MLEQVSKYMAQNARIFCVCLSDAVEQSVRLNGLSADERSVLGRLEAFACCIAALQKEERASVTARLAMPGTGSFSATADRSGIVRGRKEEDSVFTEDTLEVTLQLPLRGNYTGVVTAKGLDGLVDAYFAQSLQVAAACRVFETEQGFYCIAAEQLPGEACDLLGLCTAACQTIPFGQIPDGFDYLESAGLRFGCSCSRAALMRLVSSMPAQDREEMSSDGKIVTTCNACGKKYTFEI